MCIRWECATQASTESVYHASNAASAIHCSVCATNAQSLHPLVGAEKGLSLIFPLLLHLLRGKENLNLLLNPKTTSPNKNTYR